MPNAQLPNTTQDSMNTSGNMRNNPTTNSQTIWQSTPQSASTPTSRNIAQNSFLGGKQTTPTTQSQFTTNSNSTPLMTNNFDSKSGQAVDQASNGSGQQAINQFKQNQTQANAPDSPASASTDQTDPTDQTNNPPQSNNPEEMYPKTKLEESLIAPGMYRPLPEEVVYEWQAPSRPFKKHNAKYFSTVAIIGLLVSLILGFAGQMVAITVVLAICFLVYVLSVVPPQNITYQITTYGIRIENNLYNWEELGNYWFETKYQQDLVHVLTVRFPGRISLVLENNTKDLIQIILSEVLLNKKPELTLYEKTSQWLQRTIPLDTE